MKIALISCSGGLPEKVFEHLKADGHQVFVITFKEVTTSLSPDLCVSIGQAGKIFQFLKQHHVQHMILAGGMVRPNLWRLRFDYIGLKLALSTARFLKKGDDKLLRHICNFISDYQITLCSISDLCPKLTMPQGELTGIALEKKEHDMVAYGVKILNHLAPFDVGQSIIVSDQVVVAIEALDGTDAMIERVQIMDKKRLQSLSKPIFVKMRKYNQSNFVDLPTIGVQTIQNIAKAGIVVAAFEAGGCLIIDLDAVILEAKKHKIKLIGIENHVA